MTENVIPFGRKVVASEPVVEERICWTCGDCGCMTFYLRPDGIECAHCEKASHDCDGWVARLPPAPANPPEETRSRHIVDLNDPEVNKARLLKRLAARDNVAVFGIDRDGGIDTSYEKPDTEERRAWFAERIDRIKAIVLGDPHG